MGIFPKYPECLRPPESKSPSQGLSPVSLHMSPISTAPSVTAMVAGPGRCSSRKEGLPRGRGQRVLRRRNLAARAPGVGGRAEASSSSPQQPWRRPRPTRYRRRGGRPGWHGRAHQMHTDGHDAVQTPASLSHQNAGVPCSWPAQTLVSPSRGQPALTPRSARWPLR
jgi:hypothetical protein